MRDAVILGPYQVNQLPLISGNSHMDALQGPYVEATAVVSHGGYFQVSLLGGLLRGGARLGWVWQTLYCRSLENCQFYGPIILLCEQSGCSHWGQSMFFCQSLG